MPTPRPHLSERRLPPGSVWARVGVHADWPRAWARRGVRVRERVRWSHCGFRVLLSPRVSPCTGTGPDPTPKLRTKKKKKSSKEGKKPQHPSPLRGNDPAAPKRVLFVCSRVTVLRLRTPTETRGCAGARFPLTREKPADVRVPGFQSFGGRSGSFPPPCWAPEREPGRAPLSSLEVQPPDPHPGENGGETPGSSRGRSCWELAGSWRGGEGGKSLVQKGSGQGRGSLISLGVERGRGARTPAPPPTLPHLLPQRWSGGSGGGRGVTAMSRPSGVTSSACLLQEKPDLGTGVWPRACVFVPVCARAPGECVCMCVCPSVHGRIVCIFVSLHSPVVALWPCVQTWCAWALPP